MLREIKIKNLAVVEDVTINFSTGLNVLTGSTGAGKSIILSAVELLSGRRLKRSIIRKGADKLTIEGIFGIGDDDALRAALGMEKGEDTLSIKREVFTDGRGKIWVNGVVSTANTVKTMAESLLELHGQQRQQELLDPSMHILYLDSWGGYDELLERCRRLFNEYMRAEEKLNKLILEYEKNKEMEDFLRFQLQELESLNLYPGIDRELKNRLRKMENIHRFISYLKEASEILSGSENSILNGLARVGKIIETLSGIDESWSDYGVSIDEAEETLQELAREVDRALADSSEEEPHAVEELQEKLADIQKLCRKYGVDCAGLIKKRDETRKAVSLIEDGSAGIESAGMELKKIEKKLIPILKRLTEERKKLRDKLDKIITEEIRSVGIKGGVFRTEIRSLDEGVFDRGSIAGSGLTERGWDDVEFLIKTNVGEDLKPLSEIVSGGELSRITLILKKVFVERRRIPTLIFDEIDTGLGADLGEVVAEKLSELARHYQVICITHLPQVASKADQHIVVEKEVVKNRTVTRARILGYSERIREISRMLGGTGGLQEKLAEEMLSNTKGARSSAG